MTPRELRCGLNGYVERVTGKRRVAPPTREEVLAAFAEVRAKQGEAVN